MSISSNIPISNPSLLQPFHQEQITEKKQAHGIDTNSMLSSVSTEKNQGIACKRPEPHTLDNQPTETFVSDLVTNFTMHNNHNKDVDSLFENEESMDNDSFGMDDDEKALQHAHNDRYNLTIDKKELQAVQDHFDFEIFMEIGSLDKPTYFPPNSSLPLPVIYVPGQGSNAGIFILSDKKIGEGAASVITLALHLSPDLSTTRMAFKSIDLTNSKVSKEALQAEVSVHEQLMEQDSDFIVGTSIYFSDSAESLEEHNKLGFIMPLMMEGDLSDQLAYGNIPDFSSALDIAMDASKSLSELHDLGLVHGDIKPENFMMSGDSNVQLGDFGSAGSVGDTVRDFGTKGYAAPELTDEYASGLMDSPADTWSLGVVLTQLFCGSDFYDWSASNMSPKIAESTLDNVKSQIFELSDVPKDLKELMSKCLSLKPEDRPSCSEVFNKLDDISFNM